MTDVKMTWTDYVNEVYEHTGSQGLSTAGWE